MTHNADTKYSGDASGITPSSEGAFSPDVAWEKDAASETANSGAIEQVRAGAIAALREGLGAERKEFNEHVSTTRMDFNFNALVDDQGKVIEVLEDITKENLAIDDEDLRRDLRAFIKAGVDPEISGEDKDGEGMSLDNGEFTIKKDNVNAALRSGRLTLQLKKERGFMFLHLVAEAK